MKLISCLTLILALSTYSPTRAQGTQTQARASAIAKVMTLMTQSGYNHRKTGENTWVLERPGKPGQWMLVASGSDFLVVGIIVAVRKNMRSGADLSFQLLKLNHSLDYVKVGLDEDDDLFVRTEERIRLIDLAEFKSMVETVNTAADTTLTRVKPFLITP